MGIAIASPEFRRHFDTVSHAQGTAGAFNRPGERKEIEVPSQPSIRDQLEADAWRNHPQFARRLSRNRKHNLSRRPLRWQDRALLIISAVLLLLLIIRVETARADGPVEEFFGLEFIDQAGA